MTKPKKPTDQPFDIWIMESLAEAKDHEDDGYDSELVVGAPITLRFNGSGHAYAFALSILEKLRSEKHAIDFEADDRDVWDEFVEIDAFALVIRGQK